jgi:mono/diheme cytochrome c family protein
VKPILYGIACVTPVLFLLGMAVSVMPQPASATAAYAQQTGRACGSCHVNKSGGGALTATGKAFVAAGHKMPGKKK